MTDRPFLDKAAPPDAKALHAALGRASGRWTELHDEVASRFAPTAEKWSYGGKAYGWSLQIRRAKKTVLYMIPCRGSFLASMAFGESACAAAKTSGLAPELLTLIAAAPVFPEGRAVKLEVRNQDDVANVVRLAAIRMEV